MVMLGGLSLSSIVPVASGSAILRLVGFERLTKNVSSISSIVSSIISTVMVAVVSIPDANETVPLVAV